MAKTATTKSTKAASKKVAAKAPVRKAAAKAKAPAAKRTALVKANAAGRDVKTEAKLAAIVAKANKPAATETKAPTGAKATVLAMIQKAGKVGVSAAEIAKALGWPRAGGTISRAIKAASFPVAKVRDGEGVLRYSVAS